ncbi:ADP-ribose pyrophosphatase YjhB, NUDIX family [Nocardioides exalbidus]|uniref:ADP-ribose pyrophosphatase YjhB, NUDIX family n=1 Tax=Nocardioides exalbidus TaxID=402596 RepID=A0A1H4WAX2_9ACTN|nr:NUDIX domain-containing protein [Nocardioides exalbidus]SEC90532.1 ADP-ribose pyrophosphatase YjhB, NUDIX family [Nocardioides exalbidus]
MSHAPDRAVAVALHDGQVLVIARQKEGRAYCVLPGGGVEPGEPPEVAVLRELAEETGLMGTVSRPLWTIEHHDRRAHYFLVAVEPGPMTLGGPEASTRTTTNDYAPQWLSMDSLDDGSLQPESIRDLVRAVEAEIG